MTAQLTLNFESTDPLWRELEALEATRLGEADRYFGVCPQCERPGELRNVGRDHWFVCVAHRARWYVGSNLFSAWRDEDEVTWDRNAEELEGYRDVQEARP